MAQSEYFTNLFKTLYKVLEAQLITVHINHSRKEVIESI